MIWKRNGKSDCGEGIGNGTSWCCRLSRRWAWGLVKASFKAQLDIKKGTTVKEEGITGTIQRKIRDGNDRTDQYQK